MRWNHRIIRHADEGGPSYRVHECYYDKKGDTIPTKWTADPVYVGAETRAGLFWVLSKMVEAVGQPVLEIRDGKLAEIEPAKELPDDLKKAIGSGLEFADGMNGGYCHDGSA